MKTIQIKFKILLLLLLVGFAFTSCSSDDNKDSGATDPESLTEGQVHQIEVMLVDIIRDSGRDFPQYEEGLGRPFGANDLNDLLDGPNDYLETVNDTGGLKVRFWLDDEGNIIPSPTWQQNHPNYCSSDGRSMRAARKLLEFKIQYDSELGLDYPNQYAFGVQLNLIDVETAVIKQSVYVDPIIDQENNWVNATLNEAWNQMLERATIKGAVGPCEGQIELTVHFYSEVTTVITDEDGSITYYEKVEATFGLTFDEYQNVYKGTGNLKWMDSWITPDPGVNPFENLVGQFTVLELKTPEMEGDNQPPIMVMNFAVEKITPLWKLAWPILYDYEYDETNGLRYFIKDWEIPDDPSVLMRKVNNRTETHTEDGDETTVTENTSIEIHRQ